MIRLDANFIKTEKDFKNYKRYVGYLLAGLKCDDVCAYDRAVCENSSICNMLLKYKSALEALERGC